MVGNEMLYADGTLAGKFRRQNTKEILWPEAKAVASAWEAAGRWTGDPGASAPTPPVSAPAPESRQTTIERAVGAFLAEHEESSAANTQKKYAIIMKKLKAHSAEKGYVMIDQWGPIDVREFRSSWQVSSATAAKNLSIVKSFFEFALSNEWIARNPARLVKNPRGRASTDARNEERTPFSDDELKLMFEACETQYGKRPIRWARKTHHHQAEAGLTANYKYKWTGQDLADFISISVYTGLRWKNRRCVRRPSVWWTGACHSLSSVPCTPGSRRRTACLSSC
jgi:hypothetical protein